MFIIYILLINNNINLLRKGPRSSGPDDDLHSLLWGDQSFTGKGTDLEDEDGEKAEKVNKKRRGQGAAPSGSSARRARTETLPLPEGQQPADAAGASGDPWTLPVGSKRAAAAEAKECDRGEACALQVQQLRLQVEDGRAVMQISMSKTASMLDKIQARLDEGTKFFMEAIRKEGPGCRAEKVWQQLKDSKSLVEAISEFVEAIQDSEASASTLSSRAALLQSQGVKLPRCVNSLVLRRTAIESVKAGDLRGMLKMLEWDKDKMGGKDADATDNGPNGDNGLALGLGSILGGNVPENEDARNNLIREFQVSCITHVMNSLLMADGCAGQFLVLPILLLI